MKAVDVFPTCSNIEQTKVLNELLSQTWSKYETRDIFKYLPESIEYEGQRGDLFVTHRNIAYFSFGGGWKCEYIISFDWSIKGDSFDGFINMIKWLKENKLM